MGLGAALGIHALAVITGLVTRAPTTLDGLPTGGDAAALNARRGTRFGYAGFGSFTAIITIPGFSSLPGTVFQRALAPIPPLYARQLAARGKAFAVLGFVIRERTAWGINA